MAGSSLTLSLDVRLGTIKRLKFSGVGDDATGNFPTLVLPKINGLLIALETNPGTPALTAAWDVAITDAEGHDVLETVGANRDAANTEKVAVVYSGTLLHPPVAIDDVLTMAITGNSVNDAVVTLALYYREG